MNISDDLYFQWRAACVEEFGKPLPINQIGVDVLVFAVRTQDPPLVTRTGDAIRIFSLCYKLKDYKNELRN